mmetsp:Transcript_13932/g.40125  ORF Transcript_13932/g.40125 Transcript_13932/m.40125 type:complete len:312 (+) Transcript_13932:2336-3271(+)
MPAGRDGGRSGRAVDRRARHADDAQHLPLRRRVGQERHARRAAPQGDHQRLQAAKDAVAHRVSARGVRARLGGGQGGAVDPRAHDARLGDEADRDLVRPAAAARGGARDGGGGGRGLRASVLRHLVRGDRLFKDLAVGAAHRARHGGDGGQEPADGGHREVHLRRVRQRRAARHPLGGQRRPAGAARAARQQRGGQGGGGGGGRGRRAHLPAAHRAEHALRDDAARHREDQARLHARAEARARRPCDGRARHGDRVGARHGGDQLLGGRVGRPADRPHAAHVERHLRDHPQPRGRGGAAGAARRAALGDRV